MGRGDGIVSMRKPHLSDSAPSFKN